MLPRNSPWSSGLPGRRSVTEEILERPFGQRHEKPDLEQEKQRDRHGDADNDDRAPAEPAEPAHGRTDEERARDIDPDEADECDERDGRHENPQNVAQLDAVNKSVTLLFAAEHGEGDRAEAHHHNDQADVEWKVAGLRPVSGPAGAQSQAVGHDQRANTDHDESDDNVNGAGRDQAAAGMFLILHWEPLAQSAPKAACDLEAETKGPWRIRQGPAVRQPPMKPALVMRSLWVSAAFCSQPLKSSPSMKVVLKAPFAMNSCHSGVSRTFLNRSM